MVPSAQPTHDLLHNCMPTREEKERIASQLSMSLATIYKWCQDPEGHDQYRRNLLDRLEIILDHARLYHPAAAFAIEHRLAAGNARSVGRGAVALPSAELLCHLQPAAEKEVGEALRALSMGIRLLLLGQEPVDLRAVLREIEEAEAELKRARVMLSAAIDAEATTGKTLPDSEA